MLGYQLVVPVGSLPRLQKETENHLVVVNVARQVLGGAGAQPQPKMQKVAKIQQRQGIVTASTPSSGQPNMPPNVRLVGSTHAKGAGRATSSAINVFEGMAT